jgi:hypothetical protein
MMDVKVAAASIRLWATLLCSICVALLLPASLLALGGVMWLGAPELDWRSKIAAAAIAFAGPGALGLGAAFSREAAQDRNKRKLLMAVVCSLMSMIFYAAAWAWGGRMLL